MQYHLGTHSPLRTIQRCLILAGILIVCGPVSASGEESALERAFISPPESARPWVYWYWISDNISKEGITRDLECMARVGIGEALIGNVDVNKDHRGSVKVLSEEWWGMVEHAIREAGRLGIRIGMFNCPGWSQSGGPWITPQQTMRYVAMSERRVRGPLAFVEKLEAPAETFQDVALLAFRAPAGDAETLSARKPRVACEPAIDDALSMADGRLETACTFPAGAATEKPLTIDLEVDAPFTARSLLLHPARMPFAVDCDLQVSADGAAFASLRKFTLDRHNPSPTVGFQPYGPVAVSFPAATSKRFRLVLTNLRGRGGIAEIELTAGARLEHFVEKQLAKMCQTPFPQWDTYLWPQPAEPDSRELAIAPADVVDLTTRLGKDGMLRWDVPEEDWVILRTGMVPTGVKNAPASPEGTGFEVDKMNRAAVTAHFDAFIGHLLRRIPEGDRKAFGRVVADSYEMGAQNWTDGFAEVFRKRYGYDPLRWLPVLTGRLVGSAGESERFLWDLRRLTADRIATEYVGGLREVCERNGLRLWLENYGHWGFPGEFLQYGGQSHDIGGEFWESGNLGLIELRSAATSAHTYGKPVVSAEAFTTAGPHWTMDPWWQKRRGDWAITEGINHFVLHVYIHQPDDLHIPGINAPFGTEFNRHNTWFPHARGWIDYLRRTHGLLQQGRYVADVAYFIGEDTPKMGGARRPELPPGYSFDYINAEVIETRLQVRDGRFVLPDGMSYRLLVLPELSTMRPEVLGKIRDLVREGGAILGPPPSRSPSLQNYPQCDERVRALATELWAGCDGTTTTHARFGQGHVFHRAELQSALKLLDTPPDVKGMQRELLWTHRTAAEGEIYFISNQADETAVTTPSFRVTGRRPELWDAVTGERRPLPQFRVEGERTRLRLSFEPRQSLFLLFRSAPRQRGAEGSNFPPLNAVMELEGPWTVEFDPRWGGPGAARFEKLEDWTRRSEDGIRYYSGSAGYAKRFTLASLPPPGRRIYLDLGKVANMAGVRLNGRDLGLCWTAPWRVDITEALRAGDNELEIRVTNTWANRIIGDLRLPADQRLTSTVYPHLKPDSPLLPAGLLGPVRILADE